MPEKRRQYGPPEIKGFIVEAPSIDQHGCPRRKAHQSRSSLSHINGDDLQLSPFLKSWASSLDEAENRAEEKQSGDADGLRLPSPGAQHQRQPDIKDHQ